jgi:photosystem II stability/assembly factor-like uncharacterized protein
MEKRVTLSKTEKMMKKLQLLCLVGLALLLMACSGGNQTVNTTNPTPVAINGFGTALNHVHSLVVLPDEDHTLVLATHYGIFRSQNQGATWQETAAGANQPMQGLMTFSLSYNPLNPQRLYVLTQVATVPYKGTLGLYTSANGGQSWQLAMPNTDLPSGINSIYLAQAGNQSASEVYMYLNTLGPLGLRVSMDNGQHFSALASPLPFGDMLGLLPIPNKPGHMLAYGNGGIATTSDGGNHWQVLKNVQGSIFEMTAPGPNEPIYAEGDAGVFVSHNNGQSFNLVYTQRSYDSLTASPEQSQVVYGKLGLGVYRSNNGGQNWSALPAIKGSQQALVGDVLVADPTNPAQVYLALSYPTVVYRYQIASQSWQSITPPA